MLFSTAETKWAYKESCSHYSLQCMGTINCGLRTLSIIEEDSVYKLESHVITGRKAFYNFRRGKRQTFKTNTGHCKDERLIKLATMPYEHT